MIAVPTGVRIWIASGHTDMRKGMQGLALLVQEGLGEIRSLATSSCSADAAVLSSRPCGMTGSDYRCTQSAWTVAALSGRRRLTVWWP
jgi:hypothetical protein